MNKRMVMFILFAVLAAAIISLTTKSGYSQTAKSSNPADAGCLKCHKGIEKIADTPVMSKLTCVECHNGNPNGAKKKGQIYFSFSAYCGLSELYDADSQL